MWIRTLLGDELIHFSLSGTDCLWQSVVSCYLLNMAAKSAIPKAARSKAWKYFEDVQLLNDNHHVICILCKQKTKPKKTFIKVGGQIGTQALRNHLRGAHPEAWRDIHQEEQNEKEAKKKSLPTKEDETPKIDVAFSKWSKVDPQGKKQSEYDRALLELLASRLVITFLSIFFLFCFSFQVSGL